MGRTVTSLTRRGKYLLVHLDQGQTLLVHLGMTGRLFFQTDSCPPLPHVHLVFHLHSGHKLVYQDVRRFGQVLLYPPGVTPPALEQVGLEPWSRRLTPDWLQEKTAKLKRPIKNFLLDGRIIAGIGNIYASEALFETRLHPQTPVGQLSLRDVGSAPQSHPPHPAPGHSGRGHHHRQLRRLRRAVGPICRPAQGLRPGRRALPGLPDPHRTPGHGRTQHVFLPQVPNSGILVVRGKKQNICAPY